MLLRRAKLVCQSGEYLTLIRDVSEGGISLGFLHDVPPEPRVLLQLANDTTYPVERVWTEKRQAGYRFGCCVNLSEFLAEQAPGGSRPIRLNVSGTVRVQDGQQVLDARLLDISCEGAKIACAGAIRTRGLLTFELPGLPPQLAQVHWREAGRYGLGFQHPLDSEELALCALGLQPFDRHRSRGFARLLAKARAA
jgi:hypothetical protein